MELDPAPIAILSQQAWNVGKNQVRDIHQFLKGCHGHLGPSWQTICILEGLGQEPLHDFQGSIKGARRRIVLPKDGGSKGRPKPSFHVSLVLAAQHNANELVVRRGWSLCFVVGSAGRKKIGGQRPQFRQTQK
jgi:hypothetical protein